MAKDRHHPHRPSRRPTTISKDDTSKHKLGTLEAERVLEQRDCPRKGPSHISKEALDKLVETRNIEFPIRLTDANDRTWLLKDPLSELVECLEDSHGLASYHCRFALAGQHDTSNRAIIEEAPEKGCSPELDPPLESGMPRIGPTPKELAKKKRLPGAIHCSPTKRRIYSSAVKGRRSSLTLQEDGESDVTDEGENGEEEEEFAGITFENQGVRISEIRGTMVDILRKLQQKGLKQVLKAMLRKCHPQKQANFPYNGGKQQEQKRINGDADYDERNPGLLTAPDYWLHQDDWKPDHGHVPTGCRHREPDHIYKPERINLTMHLLHAGDRYNDAKFGLDKLRESTMNITNDYPKEFQPDAERLIEALYYAREKEIQYENGEIDADTVVYVPMPAQRPAKPKRITRSKRMVNTVKQDTPEISGFFELGTPINPSPSANSSFASVFNNAIKVESGSSSPHPSATAYAEAIVPGSHMTMKRLASQASSYPSTSASEGLDATRSSKNTPAPSEEETEAETLDEIIDTDQLLKVAERQSLNLTPLPGTQLAAHDMSSHGSVVTVTTMHMPGSVAPSLPTFQHSFPHPDHRDNGLYSMAPPDQQAIGPVYFNPTDTYVHTPGHNLMSPGYASSMTNGNYPTLTQLPTDYVPFLDSHDRHPIAPSPASIPTHNMATHSLLTGYPSSASSDFNGAMPVDPDWHAVDFSYEHFHDGTYQQQQQPRNLPLAGSEQSSAMPQGDGGNERRFWATEFDAMTHEPQRFAVQQQEGAMDGTTSADTQPLQQQMQQQPLSGHYSYPFLQQQRGRGTA